MDRQHFKRSQETALIVRYLAALEKGAIVNYGELSRVIGIPLTAHTPKLVSARNILVRDHNQVWICVAPRIGLRRLNDAEIAERLRPWWMRGARNKLRRAEREVDVVDRQQLDINQLARFGVDCIQRELAFNSLSRATRDKMEKVARGTSNDLPAFTAAEWMIALMRTEKR